MSPPRERSGAGLAPPTGQHKDAKPRTLSVLGARGVAFGDLKPWTVYIGNPMREVRKRTPIP